MTPLEAAESLYGETVRAIAADTLDAYGIDATEAARDAAGRAALGLSLYWIVSALQSLKKPAHARIIFDALRERVSSAWQAEFGGQTSAAAFWQEWEAARETYDRLNREGAGPMGIAAEAADQVLATGAVSDAARQPLIGLFLDVIPVDEIGELVAEIRLAD